MAFKNTYFIYRAKNDSTGLADVTAKVRRNGVYVLSSDISPLALTEVDEGRYQLVLSPAQISTAGGNGWFDVYIDSASKSAPATAGKLITEFDTDDLQSQVDGVETKVDVIDGNVDSIKTTVEDTNNQVNDGSHGLPNLKTLIDQIQNAVTDISNVTRFNSPVPKPLIRLDAGTKRYKIPFNMYDTNGNMEDPDSNQIQVELTDESGNSLDSYLVSFTTQPYYLTRNATGDYEFEMDIPDTANLEPMLIKYSLVENAVPLVRTTVTEIAPESAAGLALETTSQSILTDTADMQPRVADIQAKINDGTFGLSALKDLIDIIDAVVDSNNALLTDGTNGLAAIKAELVGKASQASIDSLQLDVDGLSTQASVDDIQGVGFATGTDSLVQISARLFSGGSAI